MNRLYTARHGIVWQGGDVIPMTVAQAEKAAQDFLELAITERDPAYSELWLTHVPPLVRAIRQAKEQERALPVEQKEAA